MSRLADLADFHLCCSCRYWDRREPEGDNDPCLVGHCRRDPPVVVDPIQPGAWPITSDDDWCGAWELNDPLEGVPDHAH